MFAGAETERHGRDAGVAGFVPPNAGTATAIPIKNRSAARWQRRALEAKVKAEDPHTLDTSIVERAVGFQVGRLTGLRFQPGSVSSARSRSRMRSAASSIPNATLTSESEIPWAARSSGPTK